MKILPSFQQSTRRDSRERSAADVKKEERKRYTSLVVACADEFIDIFSDACNRSFKSDIAVAIHHQRIEKVLKDVDIADMLSVESAHRIFKRCYGLRTWIYAPEEGVRGMIRESITMYYDPLKQILSDVHKITREACGMAMEECQLLQAQGNEALKQIMEEQAYDAIDCWKATTWDQLARNLHAEVEFPAPERFRSLRSSIDRLLEHEAMMQAQRLVQHYQNMIEISMKSLAVGGKDIAAMRRNELTSHAIINPNITKEPIAMAEFYMGWLEKRNRFGRWQRRWFVISAAKKRLWYFAHPEEQPARGAASLVGCAIYPEVVEEDSINELVFRLVFRQTEGFKNTDDSQQWLNMLTPGAPGKTKSGIVSLTLRASTTSSKAEWMDMIGKAILGESIKPSGDSTEVCNIAVEINGRAERKISTRVFQEEEDHAQEGATTKDSNEQQQNRRRPVRQSTKRTNTTIASFSISKEECDDDEEEQEMADGALAEELALFDEIADQASQAIPTHEEAIMLSCISEAVKNYMVDSQKLITEQASKIIADGMLPMLHKDELHTSLLKAILNPSEA